MKDQSIHNTTTTTTSHIKRTQVQKSLKGLRKFLSDAEWKNKD